jgi:hypothetical protein
LKSRGLEPTADLWETVGMAKKTIKIQRTTIAKVKAAVRKARQARRKKYPREDASQDAARNGVTRLCPKPPDNPQALLGCDIVAPFLGTLHLWGSIGKMP